MAFIEQIDRQLFLFFNGLHSPWFDFIFFYLSKPWISIPIYLYVIFLLYKQFNIKQATLFLLVLIATVGCSDFMSVSCFKNVFLRYRPSHNIELEGLVHFVKGYKGGMYGFVSSHASNTFAFAVFSSLLFYKKKLTLIFLVWAAVVSYSRLYMGVHYPTDILGGALLGSFIAYVFYKIATKIKQ